MVLQQNEVRGGLIHFNISAMERGGQVDILIRQGETKIIGGPTHMFANQASMYPLYLYTHNTKKLMDIHTCMYIP